MLTESTKTFDACSQPLDVSLRRPLLAQVAFNYVKTKMKTSYLHFAEFHCLLHVFSIPRFCSGSSLHSYNVKNTLINKRCSVHVMKKNKDRQWKTGADFLKSFIKIVTMEIIKKILKRRGMENNFYVFRLSKRFRVFSIYFYLARVVSSFLFLIVVQDCFVNCPSSYIEQFTPIKNTQHGVSKTYILMGCLDFRIILPPRVLLHIPAIL